MHGNFQTCDKDGGYTFQSAIDKNPMPHANLTALCFIEAELWPIKVYIAVISILDLFPPVALTLTRWPSYTNWHIFPEDIPAVWKWTSNVKVITFKVYSLRMRPCSYVWSLRSQRWRSHHSIMHIQNTMTHANLIALSFTEPELTVIKV